MVSDPRPVTLADCFDWLEQPTRTITVYAPPPKPELVNRLEGSTGVSSVDFRVLPSVTPDEQAFLVIHDEGEFRAAIGLEAVRTFFEPPIADPWVGTPEDSDYRDVIDVFESTVWEVLARRQLLAISREIERRAWRLGSGTLRVGFQRSAAFEAMAPVYLRLAAETDLDVHVYISDEWGHSPIPAVTIHAESGGEIGSFWFLCFDGDGDKLWTSALIARQTADDEYEGYWTDDAQLVATIERAAVNAG